MKKIVVVLLSIFLCLLLACETSNDENEQNSTEAKADSELAIQTDSAVTVAEPSTEMLMTYNQGKDVFQTMHSVADFKYASPEDVINNSSDLVKATFTEFLGSYVDKYGIIRSKYKLKIEKTVKGNLNRQQDIVIDIYGGTVTVDEYLLHFDDIDAKKMGFSKAEKYPNKYVSEYGEQMFLPKNNTKYFLALNKISDGVYTVNCGEFGKFENLNGVYHSSFKNNDYSEEELAQFVK